jgi:hypothetical protein
MMETMIPPQVGMRLRMKKKEAKINERRPIKNERKERRDNVTILFATLVLQSSTMIFMTESLL